MLAPLLCVAVAGLGDTLNHLARMHVLATISQSPDLRRYYVVDWTPIPYLAMDAVVPALLHILPIYAAGKLFVALCLLMPVAGALSLHWAVHHRLSLVPASAFLLSYNQLLSLGFLNFLFSSGLAVMLFAAWVATEGRARWPRAAAFAPLVTLLYLGHVFACLAYCLCVAGWEGGKASGPFLQKRTKKLLPSESATAGKKSSASFFQKRSLSSALDIAAAFAQAIPAIILAATLNIGAGYVGALHTVFGGVAEKLVAAASPMMFAPDRTNAAVLVATLLLAYALAPRLRLAPEIWPPLLLAGAAALAVPHLMASTWGTDLRLPLVAAMLVAGGLSWRPKAVADQPWKIAATLALFLMVGAKSADAWRVLRRADAWIAETRRVLAPLPPGARLLTVNAARGVPGSGPSDPTTIWQLPLLAVIDHDAFVPTFFSGLSTVHMRPEWRTSSTPNGFPITPQQLESGQHAADTPGTEMPDGPGGGRLYHFGWPDKFDYVLVQRFGVDTGPLPASLDLVTHGPDMDLYRIRR